MIQFKRALKIMRVVSVYRLDRLLDKRALPLFLRALIAPAALFGNNESNRGIRLRKALEELGPIFVKFGQLLSTRPDLVPTDICSELSKLQDDVPPFATELFKKTVEDALGSRIDVLFKTFDDKPLASASIAQVHGAVMPDGREVVVKAVRPNIERIIREDLALLFTIAKLVLKYSSDGERLHPVEVVSDYQNVILTELNLQSEGANASLLRHNFEDSPLLFIPEILWDYSNENVLVMDRIHATPVTDMAALKASDVDLKLLAERGVEIFFQQVFEHNFFHADMHPGNIFVDCNNPKSPTYLAIDCAIMGSLSKEDQFYMARNILAIFKRDYRLVAELHVRSGWVAKDTSINELTGAIRAVCEPVFQRPLNEISMGHMMVQLFNTARTFNMEVQPSLVLLQKTLLNVEGLGRQLYPQLDLWASAQPFLERWVRKRYSPVGAYKSLRTLMPDWIEQLPQLPPLIYGALENAQQKESSKSTTSQNNRKGIGPRITLALVLMFSGVLTAYPAWLESINEVPPLNLIVVLAAIIVMIAR